jgi:serine protease Do
MAAALGMDKPRGVLMATVNADSPADKAGVQENDVVLSVDGEPVNSISELRNRISLAGVGHEAKLEILRDGKHRNLTVALDELPADIASRANPARDDDKSEDGIDGVTVRNLTENLRARMNLDDDVSGVVVTDVSRSSDAWNRGLRQGDVIIEVARGPVSNLDEFRERLEIDADRPVLLKIRRGEQAQLLAIPR